MSDTGAEQFSNPSFSKLRWHTFLYSLQNSNDDSVCLLQLHYNHRDALEDL